jgi:hypothetical protein
LLCKRIKWIDFGVCAQLYFFFLPLEATFRQPVDRTMLQNGLETSDYTPSCTLGRTTQLAAQL